MWFICRKNIYNSKNAQNFALVVILLIFYDMRKILIAETIQFDNKPKILYNYKKGGGKNADCKTSVMFIIDIVYFDYRCFQYFSLHNR